MLGMALASEPTDFPHHQIALVPTGTAPPETNCQELIARTSLN